MVADLSVGERQRIEIVRCLLQEPKLLIMDEPTAVLTPQEADQLFVTLTRLAGGGLRGALHQPSPGGGEAPLPQRHHPAPRQGGGQCRSRQGNGGEPREAHGGRRHPRGARRPADQRAGDGAPELDRPVSLPADGPFAVALKNISLDVRAGEVVAIAGVAGNGQSELFDAVSGERIAAARLPCC